MKILGLGHYSRTGKDTLANLVGLIASEEAQITVRKVSFARKLKEISHDLYGWAGMEHPDFYDEKEHEHYRDLEIRAIGKTPVEIWCELGMKMREICPTTWIDHVLYSQHNCDLLIIPDVRFPNEVETVREAGGKLVKVVRAGFGPRKTDADQALCGWDGWDIVAGPTLEDLRQTARQIHCWAVDECIFPEQFYGERCRLLEMEER